MAAIALKRGGSFSSHSGGSSDYGGGGPDYGPNFTSNAPVVPIVRRHTATHASSSTSPSPQQPTAGGLYGSSLASLEYQYHEPHHNQQQQQQQPQRRHSMARNESQSTMGDDLSLMGECDNNSIRSDRNRPGRRASLSAAIEMTRSPPPKQRSIPKRNTSGRKVRRNSLFGNNNHKEKEAAAESLTKLSSKAGGGSRRASMAGPATGSGSHHHRHPAEEPEPTPQFFHSRKKDKHTRSVPNRHKTRSFDKNDTRITSQLRPGGKIKRPGKGSGGRRASMGALPSRLGLSKSGSKSSINSKGSNRSLLSSNSGSSSYDISDDDEYYGLSGGRGGGAAVSPYRRTVTAPTPQRSYGMVRASRRDYARQQQQQQQQQQQESSLAGGSGGVGGTKTTYQDLGYGDPEEYDPQLPPPPPPGTNKQKMFVSRRGSTGTAVSSFPTNSAAQRSLKESIQWKKTAGASIMNANNNNKTDAHHHHHHHQNNTNNNNHTHRGSNISNRRVSSDSVATSVATDKVNNTEGRTIIGGDVIPPPPPRDGSKRIPADIPPPGRRVPADVPPGKKRGPVDMPPQPTTPQPTGKNLVNPLLASNINAPRTPLGGGGGGGTMMRDDSASSHSNYSSEQTPLQSNRKTHYTSMDQIHQNHNQNNRMSATSALGSLMSDESDGSHGDSMIASGFVNTNNNMMNHNQGSRRASRGLSVLQPAKAPLGGGGSPLLGGSSLGGGGGFNLYGNKRDSDDEEEDEDNEGSNADDDEETEEDRIENKKMADFGSEAGDVVAVTATSPSTSDTAPTLGITTSTEGGSVMDMYNNENAAKEDGKKDDDSADSMTSEAPQEQSPDVVDVDDLAEKLNRSKAIDLMDDIGATGDWSGGVAEEIGGDGDWSGGVKEELLHQPRSSNSLLDRYPGSDYEYGDGADLGYGYSHLGQPQHPQIMNAYDDESERKDDYDYDFDNGYGPSDLYDEDYSSFGWREHLPRAADSMEFINMEQLMSKAKNTKGLYLPTFIPAHGCTQASDYIVRCFVARLRAGMTVTKHSRSRFCKSHDRILHILPTGYHITWIPEVEEEETEKEKKNRSKKPPTKLDLTKCLEVRHAWSRDPKSMKYTGTSTLRSKCKEGAANRSFALIYPHRTVDFTAMTVDQCKILMEGFSALCFRLQMAKLEQQSGDDETTQRSASIFDPDNESTTASLTGTNMSAPWGL